MQRYGYNPFHRPLNLAYTAMLFAPDVTILVELRMTYSMMPIESLLYYFFNMIWCCQIGYGFDSTAGIEPIK